MRHCRPRSRNSTCAGIVLGSPLGVLLSRCTVFLILLFSSEVKIAGDSEKQFPGDSCIFS